DEPLLEVSTDKVDTEIPSPVAGTLQEILVAEDETVLVGADLAVIGQGAAGESDAPEPAAEPSVEQAEPAVEEPAAGAPDEQEAKPTAPSPAAQEPAASAEPPAAPAVSAATPAAPPAADAGGQAAGTTITMPALGESVTEGTITRWLKAEGDQIAVDEPLLEVSTDKVDTEIPSPVAGTVTSILVGEDETVPVGAALAVVGGQAGAAGSAASAQEEPTPAEPAVEPPEPVAAESAPAPPQPAAPEPASVPAAAAAPEPAAPAPAAPAPATSGSEAAAYVTPLVRKLASDNNVDLDALKGTGVGGRIRKQDVLDAAAAARVASAANAPAPAVASPPTATVTESAAGVRVSPKRGTTEKMSRLRKVIAARMVESLQVSAQLTTVVEVDVTKIARLRDKAKRDFETREGTKLSFLPFFAVAAVEALKSHPAVNSSVEGDVITYHGSENLGVAVDTERGLLVPVIKDAGDLNIAGLSRKIADLAERTRTSKVSPDELGGGTFTLTNTGSRGALFDTPIINQPNVAILGTGAVVKRPVVVRDKDGDETIAIHSMVYLALSYDHRVVDGAEAARFLTTMKTRLEEGAFEASLGL
ncbi:MAG: 2-oxoglutarate dehydrogenase, E2 component, dihydrolipoamide succinyltransferase, partial [Dermatophilaceae bacterium]